MKILKEMLGIETKARQIVENAKLEADTIRKKAREDAKQLVIDGEKNLQDRLHQEVAQIEEEAAEQKKAILKETETRLANMERVAKERMDNAVDCVITMLLNK